MNWLLTVLKCVASVLLLCAGFYEHKIIKASSSHETLPEGINPDSKRFRLSKAKLAVSLTAGAFLLITIPLGDIASSNRAQASQRTQESLVATQSLLVATIKSQNEQIRLTREENIRLASEKQTEIQAERASFAKSITEEQMNALKPDFSLWAENFVTNRSIIRNSINKFTRLKEAEKVANKKASEVEKTNTQAKEVDSQLRYTGEVVRPFSFVVSYLHGLINAYATETRRSVITNSPLPRVEISQPPHNGRYLPEPRRTVIPPTPLMTNEIRVTSFDIPLNIFNNKDEGFICFFGKASWQIRAYSDDGSPCLQIHFTDSEGQESGVLKIWAWRSDNGKPSDLLQIEYTAKFPSPDLSEFNSPHSLAGYEAVIRHALDGVVAVQLVQAVPEQSEQVLPSTRH